MLCCPHMKWEYAALELLELTNYDGYSKSSFWVLRKNNNDGKRSYNDNEWKNLDMLYSLERPATSLDLVNRAALDGWEMAGQLPIYYNNDYSRYHTCSMMRRRID